MCQSYKKNDLVTVTIEDIGTGGEGIGKVNGFTLFVKDAVVGDVVEARITLAKKTICVCPYGEAAEGFSLSRGTQMSSSPALWRLSDPGSGL